MTEVPTPYPFALMLPQSETERLLEECLSTFGICVERQVEWKQFQSRSDGVSYTLVHPNGSEELVEASWLIGCDGAHSTVRHQLGMQFHGEKLLSDWILADVHLSGVSTPPEVTISLHSDGVLALFPLSQTRYRIVANVGESHGPVGEGHRPNPTMLEIQDILDKRSNGGIQARDPVWLASFSISERMVSDYRVGRVFLAGDAAHVHSPAGGQGMNSGIQDACNLAWKLALVARGTCVEEPLLSSYSSERSGVARLLLNATGKATVMAVLKSGILRTIRNHVASLLLGLSPVTRMAANVLSEMSVAYRDSPLSLKLPHTHIGPHAGDRAPIRESEPPVGAGNTPRFALFAEDTDLGRRLLSKYSGLLEASVRKPYADGSMWLVRPDGYVALVTRHTGWQDVDSYLSHLTSK